MGIKSYIAKEGCRYDKFNFKEFKVMVSYCNGNEKMASDFCNYICAEIRKYHLERTVALDVIKMDLYYHIRPDNIEISKKWVDDNIQSAIDRRKQMWKPKSPPAVETIEIKNTGGPDIAYLFSISESD